MFILIELSEGQSEFLRKCGRVFAYLFVYAVASSILYNSFELMGAKKAFPRIPFDGIAYSGGVVLMWAMVKYRWLLFKLFLGLFAVSVLLNVVDALVGMGL